MDRPHAQPLDVPSLARIANLSEAHFIRSFRATFGETPHRYLQPDAWSGRCSCSETGRRMTDISFDVGFTSLGSFGWTFRETVGETPTAYRSRAGVLAVPTCFTMAWTRPSSFGEARPRGG